VNYSLVAFKHPSSPRKGNSRIKVVNDLAVPTSVHRHGIHQHQTWPMDGVEDVSRPPIPAGSEFVYEFRAEPSGTHWYHSGQTTRLIGFFMPKIILYHFDRKST
jgi:hypothetical protein